MRTWLLMPAATALMLASSSYAEGPGSPMAPVSTNAYVLDLESSIAQLRDDITALKRSLEKDIQSLREQIAALNRQVGERRGGVSPFDTLERRVTELERDLRDLENTLKQLDRRVQRLETKR